MNNIDEQTLPDVGVEQLIEAGLHFGHQTKRWNPKMQEFIFGERNGIYIIDLAKTLTQIKKAQEFIYDIVVRGNQVLFVGTKKQAQEVIQETASKLKQPYVVHRWLGGMLTNNTTIRQSVRRMRELAVQEADGTLDSLPSKKEASSLRRELTKLQRNLSGVAEMDKMPAAIIVVDLIKEQLAIKEALRLNIPVVALVDSNADPSLVDYPIPGNDDGSRAIKLIVNLLGDTIQTAHNQYAEFAAEEARKRAIADKEADEKRKVAEAERKERQDAERQEREKAVDVARKKEEAEKVKSRKDLEAKVEAEKVAAAAALASKEATKADDEKKAAAAEVKEEAPAKKEEAKKEEAKEEAPAKEEAAPAKEEAEAPAADATAKEEKKEEAPAADDAPAADEKSK